MSKRLLILILGLMVVLASAGCFDLFAVPGVQVSPDGNTVYFLAPAGADTSEMAQGSLSSISINGGQPTTLTTGSKTDLTSAFAVNPTNGDIAYIETTKDNGTQVMVSSGGSAHALVTKDAFGGSLGIGTEMRYSPDGSHIAVSMIILPPDVTFDTLEQDSANSSSGGNPFSSGQLAGLKFVLYLVNTGDGTATAVSDKDKESVNTLAWSPDSKLLAYNAWTDGNGDGKISTMPSFSLTGAGGASDLSQIRIYDVGSGKVTPIDSKTTDYAETFLSNTEVAYVSLDFGSMMAGGASGGAGTGGVTAYDTASGQSRVAYQPKDGGLVIGMALSPDGSQVAWVELPSSDATGAATGGSGSSNNQPSELYVGANFDASAGPIAEIPGDTGFPDAPVWTPDGKSVLVSSTNIFASMMGQLGSLGSSFGTTGTSTGATAVPTEAIPTQKLLKVDVASKAVSTVYTGPMSNSSLFASVIGLASSDMMSSLSSLGGDTTPTPSS